MADADVAGPPGNLSGGGPENDGGEHGNPQGKGKGTDQGGPVGTGTSVGMGFDAGAALSGLIGNIQGLFDPSAPVTGVETDPVPLGHPDFGLSGTAMDPEAPSPGYASTDPGHTKSVDKKGKAYSYNMARQINLHNAIVDAALAKKTELDNLKQKKNKTRQEWKEINKLSRQYRNLIESDQYSKAMARNNPALGIGAKALASALGLGIIGIGPAIESFAIEHGFVDDTTPQDIMDADPADDAPEGPSFIDDEGEQSSATFWSLMNVVKNNPSVFKNIDPNKLKNLMSNPSEFWKFFQESVSG